MGLQNNQARATTTGYDGVTNVLEWLISHGANINARNNDGREPVHLAAEIGRRYKLEWLVSHGANVNAQDKYGNTPLDRSWPTNTKKWIVSHGGKSGKSSKK